MLLPSKYHTFSAKEIHKIWTKWICPQWHLLSGTWSEFSRERSQDRMKSSAWGKGHRSSNVYKTLARKCWLGHGWILAGFLTKSWPAIHFNLNNPTIITTPLHRWGNGGSERWCNLSKLSRLVRVTTNIKIKFWHHRLCLLF